MGWFNDSPGIWKRRARASGLVPTSARARMSRTISAGTATPADGEHPEPAVRLGWLVDHDPGVTRPKPWIRCPQRSQVRPCRDVPESSRSVEYFLAPQVLVASSASRDGFGVPQASLSETVPARPGCPGPLKPRRRAATPRSGASKPLDLARRGLPPPQVPPSAALWIVSASTGSTHEGRCAPLATPR